jgi:predicted  nucleic acid-binding Zn-ribbon protein
MTDIVERLRSQDPNGLSILLSIQEAADEIERLRAERDERTAEIARLLIETERLRAALEPPQAGSPTKP